MRKFLPSGKSARQKVFESLGQLWDNAPITKWQQTSVITGDLFEEVSKKLLSLGENEIYRYNTAGWMCPDMVEKKRKEFYVESKAHGPSGGRWVLYTDQIKNYKDFLIEYFPHKPDTESFDPSLLYLFWTHRVKKVSDYPDRDSLRKSITASGSECFILDFSIIQNLNHVALLSDNTAWSRTQSSYYQLRNKKLDFLKVGNIPAFIALWHLESKSEDFKYCRKEGVNLSIYDMPMECNVYSLIKNRTAEHISIKNFLGALEKEGDN